MACDCLTKEMNETYLLRILETNHWDCVQTEAAKAIKARKAAGVQRRRAEKQSLKDEDDHAVQSDSYP